MSKNPKISEQQIFDDLSPYQKRRFVPKHADLTKLKDAQGLYHQLINRDIHAADEFEQWILDRSELESVQDQQGTILYILMTCQTDNTQRAQNYKDFIETIIPAIKPLEDQLEVISNG